jgi:hypothetical protein
MRGRRGEARGGAKAAQEAPQGACTSPSALVGASHEEDPREAPLVPWLRSTTRTAGRARQLVQGLFLATWRPGDRQPDPAHLWGQTCGYG